MNDSVKGNKRKYLPYVLYILLVLFAVGFVSAANILRPYNVTKEYDDFDTGWYDEYEKEVKLDKIKSDMVIKKDIPEEYAGKSLFMRVKNLNVDIYLDGELYKRYGDDVIDNIFYKTPGTYFITIPLSDSKTVEIAVYCPYASDSSCNIKDVYIGNEESIIKNQITRMMPGFCISMLIIMLGIIFCVAAITLRKYGNKAMSLLALGLFNCTFGVWAGLEMKLLQLIVDNPAPIHIGVHLSLMLTVMPIFIFFRQRGETKDKIGLYTIITITTITFIFNVFSHFLYFMDMHETIRLTHITLGVGSVFTLKYAYDKLKKTQFKDPTFWGLTIIGICAVIDVIMYYNQLAYDSSLFIKIGVLVYMIALGVDIIGEYAKIYSANLKAKMLEKIAYEDLLTGFYNHNMFISDMKLMNKEQVMSRGKSILIFDMNCLKYINDTFGHSVGDEALKESAEYIKECFGDIGKCYRTGGDEFAIISDNCTPRTVISKAYSKLREKTAERNRVVLEDKPYPLYIAFGYEIIKENAQDTLKQADANMYKNKQRIKAELAAQNPELIRQQTESTDS